MRERRNVPTDPPGKPLAEFFDPFDALAENATPLTPSASPAPRRRTGGFSGWMAGIVIGVLAGLWMLPPVRYTLGSQLRFALVQDSLPWLRSLDSQRSQREQVELDVAASLLPDDYLLQVGRATVSVTSGSPRPSPLTSIARADSVLDPPDRALLQLTRVARDFPLAPGAQAHLARYMISDRIRIQRAELAKGNTIPPRFTDVKLMTWALNNGKRIDP